MIPWGACLPPRRARGKRYVGLCVSLSLRYAYLRCYLATDVGAVSAENTQLVAAFVNDPTEFVGKHAKVSGSQRKGPLGDYAPASRDIQSILAGSTVQREGLRLDRRHLAASEGPARRQRAGLLGHPEYTSSSAAASPRSRVRLS